MIGPLWGEKLRGDRGGDEAAVELGLTPVAWSFLSREVEDQYPTSRFPITVRFDVSQI